MTDIAERSDSFPVRAFLWRIIFGSSSSAVIVRSRNGAIEFGNSVLCRMLGYLSWELVGLTVFDLTHPDDHPNILRAREGSSTRRYLRKDRTEIACEVTSWPVIGLSSGSMVHVDIGSPLHSRAEDSERIANSEQLLNQTALQKLISSSFDAVIVTNGAGEIESIGPGAERVFGYEEAELLGEKMDRVIPDHPGATQWRRSGASNEVHARAKDGRNIWVSLSCCDVSWHSRGGYVYFFRDLTAIKAMEERLQQAQKMQAVGNLVAGIAHDFNNVLMGITGCASIALDYVDAGRSDRTLLKEIKKAADSGKAMTQQLLAFGRKSEVAPVVLEPDRIVRHMLSLIGRLLGEDIEFSVNLGASGGRVVADAGQLGQVLMNLAVNARDAMPMGGQLRIETRTVELEQPKRVRNRTVQDVPRGRYVELAIADDGCGMSEETLDELFEPFYTTKEVGEGTGLGMANVYDIIARCQGYIDVDSTQGGGSRFTILLPRTLEELPVQTPPPMLGPPEVQGRILLCEDDRLVRLTIAHYLEAAGYEVVMAARGDEAIDACARGPLPPDLLLTDIVLPDQGGDQVAKQVRMLCPEIQVLYMTAHAPERVEREGRIQSASEALQKPFSREQLILRVRKLLGDRAFESEPLQGANRQASVERVPGDEASTLAVLLVEDSEAARHAISQLLMDEGYEVQSAADGASALELFQAHQGRWRAVLIDYSLPDTTGDRLASTMRKASPDLPIIYMSGFPQLGLKPDGVQLEKPIDLESLAKVVRGMPISDS